MFKAKLTQQKNGSTILLNIAGTHQDVMDAFNSLFNWGAVGDVRRGDEALDFIHFDHLQQSAHCWTTPEKLFRYFYNRHLNEAEDLSGLIGEAPLLMRRDAFVAAKKTLAELESSPFHFKREIATSEYTTGTDKAEKPDDCFRDYMVTRGLQSRE